MTPARRPATYQDVIDAPANTIAEVIDGQLHLQPRPARPHEGSYAAIYGNLWGAYDMRSGGGGPRGWVIRPEPELHLHDDIVVPDLAGWRAERYDWDHEDDAFHTLVADWCCEIVSPSSIRHDRVTKANVYAREGVAFFWVVHPTEKWIEAFERLPSSDWKLLGVFEGDEPARIAPFDAIELPMASIWGRRA
jgi:Uma2 family endonuclease